MAKLIHLGTLGNPGAIDASLDAITSMLHKVDSAVQSVAAATGAARRSADSAEATLAAVANLSEGWSTERDVTRPGHWTSWQYPWHSTVDTIPDDVEAAGWSPVHVVGTPEATVGGAWFDETDSYRPREAALAPPVPVQVAAGHERAAVLMSDGTVVDVLAGIATVVTPTWGERKPTHVAGREGGGYAVCDDGTVWAWGTNTYGELGNGSTTSSADPVQITPSWGSRTPVQIAAQWVTTFVLMDDGTLWGWGRNTGKALGSGSQLETIPVQIIGGWAALKSVIVSHGNGTHVAFASDESGNIWQIGDVFPNSSVKIYSNAWKVRAPVKLAARSAAGTPGGLALMDDGTVWAWGRNYLGDGSTTSSPLPVEVTNTWGPRTPVQVACHYTGGLILMDDGTLWGWGGTPDLGNGLSQLGQEQYPVRIASFWGARTPVLISGMSHPSLILMDDGTLWGWNLDPVASATLPEQIALPVLPGVPSWQPSSDPILITFGEALQEALGTPGYAQFAGRPHLAQYLLPGNPAVAAYTAWSLSRAIVTGPAHWEDVPPEGVAAVYVNGLAVPITSTVTLDLPEGIHIVDVIAHVTEGDPIPVLFTYEALPAFHAALTLASMRDVMQWVKNTTATTLAMVSGLTSVSAPVGAITMYGGLEAPANWLPCQGQAVERAMYPLLFETIGTSFGNGDGSTTFNLPDLRHRFPYGANSSGDLATTGGAASHTHPLSDSAVAALSVQSSAGNEVTLRRVSLPGGVNAQSTHKLGGSLGTASDSTALTMGTALRGATDTGSSLPPYLTVQYIIRCL
jgi:microcystin-dependent protein